MSSVLWDSRVSAVMGVDCVRVDAEGAEGGQDAGKADNLYVDCLRMVFSDSGSGVVVASGVSCCDATVVASGVA